MDNPNPFLPVIYSSTTLLLVALALAMVPSGKRLELEVAHSPVT